tara:strand:- start:2692 stop:4134 length:1443 start_codon:yes stop_codon:yes gene_type:complete
MTDLSPTLTEIDKSQLGEFVRKYNENDPNDEDYRIPPMLFRKIRRIIDDPRNRRYRTVDEFMSDSLELFTTWWTRPEQTTEMMGDLWSDMTDEMKEQIKINAPPFYEQMQLLSGTTSEMSSPDNMMTTSVQELRVDQHATESLHRMKETEKVLTKTNLDFSDAKNALPYDGYPLIWSFYTRFFPVKISLIVLAEMIREQIDSKEINSGFVNYEAFQKRTYDMACVVSEEIRKYEKLNKIPRNLKISTGLPFTSTNFPGKTSEEEFIEKKKVESSKNRFTRQYLGRQNKDGDVSGILNAGEFAQFIDSDTGLKIGFTTEGFEFYKLNNDIISELRDDGQISKINSALTTAEQKFIISEIIPKFELESMIVNGIGNEFNNKDKIKAADIDTKIDEAIVNWENLRGEELQKQYKIYSKTDEKLTLVTRIATMGRLNELGFVKWNMESDGSSSYNSGDNFSSMFKGFKKSCKESLDKDILPLLE